MTNGLAKLNQSAKAWFSVIILLLCVFVALKGDMSPAFAACVSTIGTIFLYAHSKNDRAAMNIPANNPPNVVTNIISTVERGMGNTPPNP